MSKLENPLDNLLLLKEEAKSRKVIVVEEHSIIGGLGSAVSELLSEHCPVPCWRIGMQDVYGQSGPASELLKFYKLDGEGIYKQIKKFL